MAFRTVKIPPGAAWPPATGGAAFELATGTNITYPVWHFDGASTETIFFNAQVPAYYQGGTVKIRLQWFTTGTTGNVRWAVSMQPKRATSVWDAAFPTPVEVLSAVPGVAGQVAEVTIDVTAVVALVAGDNVLFRVSRLGGAATDTLNAIDANLVDIDWLINMIGPQNITTRAASPMSTNITLVGGAPNTLDGVTLAAGDIVFPWQQTAGAENGLYVISVLGTGANGTWVRASFMDVDEEVPPGLMIWVAEGNTMSKVHFLLVTPGPIVIGVTALTFVSGRAYVRDDIVETTIRTATAFTLVGAPVTTDAIEMTDYSDIDVSLTVTNNVSGTITDIVILAQWSSQASPTDWDTFQSDDAIAEGEVLLENYTPTRVATGATTYRIGTNYPKRGRWMRFAIYANVAGGLFSATALRHVRG